MVFGQFDTNDDGLLNFEEVKAYLAQTSDKTPDQTEMQSLFDQIDVDKNGHIDK